MKTEKTQLRVFVLFLFLLVVLSVSSASFAAVTAQPAVRGYLQTSSSGGYYGSAQNTFNAGMAPSYNGTGDINVGGKKIAVPAKVPLSATAGKLAKDAMRLNPWVLAGTLALPWLLENGMEWVDGEWKKKHPNTDGFTNCSGSSSTSSASDPFSGITQAAAKARMESHLSAGGYAPTTWGSSGWYAQGTASEKIYDKVGANRGSYYCLAPKGNDTYSPSNDADWDALPNPIPTVGPELPTAPYTAPKGASVDAPTYDFAPFSAPTGAPYQKADGSTVQPMVKVSPNVTNVTYNTYNTTTHNSAGVPVVDAPPSDENADEIKDPCDLHPERAGCAELGTDDFKLTKETVTIPFAPEASPITGSCPAPISLPNGGVLSFASACDSMVMIKPIVLALAGVMVAYMVLGAMRT